MYKQLLRQWSWSGIDQTSLENVTPYRLTNIIAFIVIFVLTMQLPFAFLYLEQGGAAKLYLLFSHLFLLLLVPVLNRLGFYQSASLFLIGLYTSYLAISCLHWHDNLNIQYFLALAIIVVPFLFSEGKEILLWLSMGLLCCAFLLLEFLLVGNHNLQSELSNYQQTIRQSNALFFLLAAILCAIHIRRNTNSSWRKLAKERKRSESLLLNILPSSIAERLKCSNTLVADYFEQASILFADIQGFTYIAKQRSPQQLVALLNEIFSSFDAITQKYGLEKIKTMGDEYMAVAGVPDQAGNHAVQCCKCAQEMRDKFETISKKHALTSGLRVGIGSGEVIAGVIGKNKFSYDLWGDAVNLASRMESQGQNQRIQVTESTYQLAKNDFVFSKRGELQVKGIGTVSTYWLD